MEKNELKAPKIVPKSIKEATIEAKIVGLTTVEASGKFDVRKY